MIYETKTMGYLTKSFSGDLERRCEELAAQALIEERRSIVLEMARRDRAKDLATVRRVFAKLKQQEVLASIKAILER